MKQIAFVVVTTSARVLVSSDQGPGGVQQFQQLSILWNCWPACSVRALQCNPITVGRRCKRCSQSVLWCRSGAGGICGELTTITHFSITTSRPHLPSTWFFTAFVVPQKCTNSRLLYWFLSSEPSAIWLGSKLFTSTGYPSLFDPRAYERIEVTVSRHSE